MENLANDHVQIIVKLVVMSDTENGGSFARNYAPIQHGQVLRHRWVKWHQQT